jgi:CubicO group peptidase (beta-lactamase class C family)
MTESVVHGEVAPGYEPVRAVFEQLVPELKDGGGAYAAYVRGEKVADLWAGVWQEDTTAQFMSVTKALTALCLQILHDRGQLDVFAPVAAHWPEFAANGKDAITIADVLTHRSGVIGDAALSRLVDHDTGAGWDDVDAITATLAASRPFWEPGTKVGYHTTTYGWILGEVIRRVDGRDLGTFFREEVAKPLGVEAGIGAPVEDHARLAPVLPLWWPPFPPEIQTYLETFFAACRDDSTAAGVSCQARHGVGALDRLDVIFNNIPARVTPLGGSNLTGTARDVARVFAAMAEPDGLGGTRPASPASFELFTTPQESRDDIVLMLPVTRGLGYTLNIAPPGRPPTMGPNPQAFGHGGAGGQFGFSDPVARVGAAGVRNHHAAFSLAPLMLNAALYDCLATTS